MFGCVVSKPKHRKLVLFHNIFFLLYYEMMLEEIFHHSTKKQTRQQEGEKWKFFPLREKENCIQKENKTKAVREGENL